VRFGGHTGRGRRGPDGRAPALVTGRRRWRARALAAAAALSAVTVTAGCAGLGGAAASGQSPVASAAATATATAGSTGTVTARAVTATATAAAPAATTATMPSPRSRATVTFTPSPSGDAASATDPAASAPPPSGAADQRLVTFVNRLQQTIWVAAAPSATSPLSATGWVVAAGQSVTISTPNNLNTRFWGRTGCVFNSAGVGHCQSGDCGGLFQCKGWGTIPATLAEVNFGAWDGLDFYDVSMVDGDNLPMWINIAKSSGGTIDKISQNGCVAAGCTKAVACPSALDVKAGGAVVGCISACARLGGDQYCCQGPYASRAACNPAQWPVDYAAVFKSAEPYAYSYVDDDATSVFTCSGVCDYRITFGLTP
jgi:Thaumatin family